MTAAQSVPSENGPTEAVPMLPTAEGPKPKPPSELRDASERQNEVPTNQLITNRQQAIQAGFLIDVSTDAQKLGLTFPVTVTKPLWEVGIAPGDSISDDEKLSLIHI